MPIRKALEAVNGYKSTIHTMPTGAELYRQGENCGAYFVILSGWIALSTLLEDGACQILDFALPGAFLGLPLGISTLMYHSARCLTPVKACSYPRQQLDDAIEYDPKLARLLCRVAAFDESRAHDHLINLALRSARERIAHLLVELCVRISGHLPIASGDIIRMPLTQGYIGQAVGLTGVHVSRTLRTLREQQIARFINRDLEILDADALMRAAGLERSSFDGSHLGATTSLRTRTRPGVASRYLMPAGWEFEPDGAIAL